MKLLIRILFQTGLLFFVLQNTQGVDYYSYTTTANNVTFQMYIPSTATTVKGIYYFLMGGSMNSNKHISDADKVKFVNDNNLALMTVDYSSSTQSPLTLEVVSSWAGNVVFEALNSFATQSSHAEVKNLPLFLNGVSNGAIYTILFTKLYPSRVIGTFATVGFNRGLFGDSIVSPYIQVPSYFISAENDSYGIGLMWHFANHAYSKPLWSIALIPDMTHGSFEDTALIYQYMRTVLALRLPANPDYSKPLVLQKVDRTKGWLGDNSTKVIGSYDYFNRDREFASWFPNQGIAENWQKIVSKSTVTGIITSITTNPYASMYFGEEEPGLVPKVFAPGVISVKGRNEFKFEYSPGFKKAVFTGHVVNAESNVGYSTYSNNYPFRYLNIYESERSNDVWSNPQIPVSIKDKATCYGTFSPTSDDSVYYIDFYNKLLKSAILSGGQFVDGSAVTKTGPSCGSVSYFTLAANRAIYYAENTSYSTYFNTNKSSYCGCFQGSLSSTNQMVGASMPYTEYPAISKDGKTLVFSENGDLFLRFKNSNNAWSGYYVLDRNVNTDLEEGWPAFSPDDQYLFFSRYQSYGKDYDLFWVNSDVIKQAQPLVFNTSYTSLNVNPVGTNIPKLKINSNIRWNIIKSGWVTCSATSGSDSAEITISVTTNPTSSTRSGYVVVSCGIYSITVSITQTGENFLELSTDSISMSGSASSQGTFTVNSNVAWTAQSSQSWLVPNVTSGTGITNITLTSQANPSEDTSRTAYVSVSADGVSTQILKVVQLKYPKLTLSVSRLTANYAGGNIGSFDIISNMDWKIASNLPWVTFDKISGTGNATINVTLPPNTGLETRAANVNVSASNGLIVFLVVKQYADTVLYLSADDLVMTSSAACNETFRITTNVDWNISSNQTWLTPNKTYGYYSADIQLSATENRDTIARSAQITVWNKDVDTLILNVTQPAALPTVEPGQTEFNFNSEADTSALTIRSNVDWVFENENDWIVLEKYSGSKDDTIYISVKKNVIAEIRVGEIKIKGQSAEAKTITINQSGATSYLTISVSSWNPGFIQDSSLEVIIHTNDSWIAQSTEDWISINKSSGKLDDTIHLSASQNFVPTQRIGTVTINTASLQSSTIQVNQMAYPQLVLSDSVIHIEAKTEDTTSVKVGSNYQWEFTCNNDWLHLQKSERNGEDLLLLHADFNETSDARQTKVTLSVFGIESQDITVVQEAEGTSSRDISLHGMSLSPNPVREKLIISLPQNDQPVLIEIYDNNGAVVLKENLSDWGNKVNTTDLKSGMYIIKVVSGSEIYLKKFIKI
jgi:hypothetical protein